jgi:hypothetical protein
MTNEKTTHQYLMKSQFLDSVMNGFIEKSLQRTKAQINKKGVRYVVAKPFFSFSFMP